MRLIALLSLIVLALTGCQHTEIYFVPVSGERDIVKTTKAEAECKSKNLDSSDLGNLLTTLVKGYDKATQECMTSRGYKRIEKPKPY